MDAQHIARQFRSIAKFIELAGSAGLLTDSAPPPPAPAAPPPPPPAAKPEKAKRSPRKGRGGKASAVADYYRANPTATAPQAAAAVGCSRSLASEVIRSLSRREGESPAKESTAGGDDDDDEPPRAVHFTPRDEIVLPTFKPEPEQQPAEPTAHELQAKHDAELLAAIRALDTRDMRLWEIANEIDFPTDEVKRACRRHNIPFSTKRGAKKLDNPFWELPADLVDIIAPEIGAELQRWLYEERAPRVRALMKARRLEKANCYPVDPVVLDRLNLRDTFPGMHCPREVIE